MDRPDFATEVVRDVHEHEILLSFTDDSDAMYFEEWLCAEGFRLFECWFEGIKP